MHPIRWKLFAWIDTPSSRRRPDQVLGRERLDQHQGGLHVLALLFATGLLGGIAQPAVLEGGAARTDITPTEPVQLAGYASRKELTDKVHDPLSARVLAFKRDGQRLAVVSLDNVGFYRGTAAPLREAILSATGLRPAELMLCAIHTHSAPSLMLEGHPNNVAYTRRLQSQLADAVRAALGRLEPIELQSGSGASPVGVNRRESVEDQQGNVRVVLGRNPEVLTDREVQVLRVAPAGASETLALLFAYATHSTSLGPGNLRISGDIHGLAEQFLERYLGDPVVALGFAGASGDIDPWVRILPDFRTERGWIPEPVLLGTLLGQEVVRVLEGLPQTTIDGPIRSAMRTVSLSAKSTPDASEARQEPTKPFTLTVAAIGDLALVGFGGEVFNEIGRAVKSASPFPTTWILSHCNAADGYVPTRSSYAQGGYEVQTSPFAPGADEQLIQATLQALNELR